MTVSLKIMPCPHSADLRAESDSLEEHGLAADPEFERHRRVMAARHAAGAKKMYPFDGFAPAMALKQMSATAHSGKLQLDIS
jgi:hypothetical protein